MRLNTLSDRLRWARETAGISQRKLSELAGITKAHVWVIELSKDRRVTAETVASLARVLGVSIDWLYLGAGRAPSKAELERAVERATALTTATG